MFQGFCVADFDCYEPRKWKSNVFNRERLDVKQKLLTLAETLTGEVLGADGTPLLVEASVEHPALGNHKQVEAQHLFFSRHAAARKEIDGILDRKRPIASLLDDPTPQRNHLFLAVTVSQEALEVSLRLHPDAEVDRQNLVRKLEAYYEAERILALLRSLPTGYHIGVLPALVPLDATAPLLEQLHALIAQLPVSGSLSVPGQVPHLFVLGHQVSRQEILAQSGPDQAAWIRARLVELLPFYQWIAWSRDNDFVSMRDVLDKEKAVKRQRGMQKGDRVRVVHGMLSGKDGVVQEIDAKGHLKVLVGKMVVKIDAADVERSPA